MWTVLIRIPIRFKVIRISACKRALDWIYWNIFYWSHFADLRVRRKQGIWNERSHSSVHTNWAFLWVRDWRWLAIWNVRNKSELISIQSSSETVSLLNQWEWWGVPDTPPIVRWNDNCWVWAASLTCWLAWCKCWLQLVFQGMRENYDINIHGHKVSRIFGIQTG